MANVAKYAVRNPETGLFLNHNQWSEHPELFFSVVVADIQRYMNGQSDTSDVVMRQDGKFVVVMENFTNLQLGHERP